MKNNKGFTLIELLIVVAIIAILAAIAIPQFSAYRLRAFNGAAQSDLRNAKTNQESVFAEYRGFGSTQNGATLNALANPLTPGTILPGPLNAATGDVAGAAIATRMDTNSDGVLDATLGFGLSVSNNVSLVASANSVGTDPAVDFVSYQMRAKHRDGNRGFGTNVSPAVCFSENTSATYLGVTMTAAARPTILNSNVNPCGGMPSDGQPVATYIAM